MSDQVPRVTSLEDVYSVSTETGELSAAHRERFHNLIQTFKKNFGTKPDCVARSPGRVNIIGEHVDYSLYNVLPTAVSVDALIAMRVTDSKDGECIIKVTNVNPSKYPAKEILIPSSGKLEIDPKNHEWSNYFKAGLSGSLEFLQKEEGDSFKPASMEVLVDGNVPAGGGLSSSAAFVCAAALAVMEANKHKVTKQDLLDLSIVSERQVGVFSGGMDQAASIFSERGFLLYCRFFPHFKAEHVPVPDSDPHITFLIAQSFITSDKAVTAPKHYNLRVVECTLATVILAKLCNLTLQTDNSSLGYCLRNFQAELIKKLGKEDLDLKSQLDTLIPVIEENLTQTEGYTREDMASLLSISTSDLEKTYMSKFPVEADKFKLRQRALHVVKEARRVLSFAEILRSTSESNSSLSSTELSQLGDLMNTTQDSCRDDYECSCPEIDQICRIARENGALGSRLTGAGWGGCTVHLVPTGKVGAVTEALKKEYYYKTFPDISEEKLKEAIVVSEPGQGSQVIEGAVLDL